MTESEKERAKRWKQTEARPLDKIFSVGCPTFIQASSFSPPGVRSPARQRWFPSDAAAPLQACRRQPEQRDAAWGRLVNVWVGVQQVALSAWRSKWEFRWHWGKSVLQHSSQPKDLSLIHAPVQVALQEFFPPSKTFCMQTPVPFLVSNFLKLYFYCTLESYKLLKCCFSSLWFFLPVIPLISIIPAHSQLGCLPSFPSILSKPREASCVNSSPLLSAPLPLLSLPISRDVCFCSELDFSSKESSNKNLKRCREGIHNRCELWLFVFLTSNGFL